MNRRPVTIAMLLAAIAALLGINLPVTTSRPAHAQAAGGTGGCYSFSFGGCVEISELTCSNIGGVWFGEGTDCTSYSAACCIDGNCVSLTEETCAAAGGDWLGQFALCLIKQCPPPCEPDLNGDQTVDIQDLLDLLSRWGPCDT